MPKVSVIVPNYNHARFLEQRISSVLEQTYQDFELLYLDDASTDDSAKVFAPFQKHPKIRAVLNDANSGSPFKQWNKGVREARGEYVWLAEADDYADPRLLEKLVAQLDTQPTVGIAYTQSWIADELGKTSGTMQSWTDDLNDARWQSDFVNAGVDECCRFLIMKCTLPNASAIVFRKSVYEQAGYANEDMKVAGDWMMWAKMLSLADIAFLAEPLNYFRHHSRSVRSTKKRGLGTQERYRIVQFICEKHPVAPAIKSAALDSLCESWLTDVFSRHRRLPQTRIRSLYQAARQLEARPQSRIARKSWELFTRKTATRFASGR